MFILTIDQINCRFIFFETKGSIFSRHTINGRSAVNIFVKILTLSVRSFDPFFKIAHKY